MLLEWVDARLRKSGMCDGVDTPETDMTNRAPAVQTILQMKLKTLDEICKT